MIGIRPAKRRFGRNEIMKTVLARLFVACAVVEAALATEPKEITNSIGMKLVRIEPGTFTMGQDGPPADYQTVLHADRCDQADWDERPSHRVTITTALHIATTEATNAQYRQFKPGANAAGKDDEAAIFVSWHDATKFCEWLSAKENRTYRLPTEAEWEYACRAGTTTLFHTGDRLPDGFQKWKFNDKIIKRFFSKTGKFPRDYRDWPAEAPLRVAQTPANAWGLFDMHGNVEEWCLDWYGPYEAGEQVDSVGRADGDFRVTRGGSHSDFTRMLRSANRSGRLPETANDRIGFRVVLGERPKTPPLPVPPPPLNARDVSQSVPAKVERITKPFFSGPKQFVKVPPNQAGPLFSNHNHSPAIAECPNGDLLAVWFSCGDEGGAELAVIASRLRRGAGEWEEASPFWDGPDINDHAPKLWFDGDRTLFFFAKGLAGDVVRTSADSGATWSKARVLQPEAEIGNMPIRTREGFLVLPLDGNKPGASLNISRDGGQTWTFTPGHGKPDFRAGGKGERFAGIHNAIVQLADGRIMALGRFDLPQEQEKFNFRTPVSYSSDLGKTWIYEASEFPAIGSVQRVVLMRLHEGSLLFCSFTDEQRYWPKRKGMTFKAADGSEFTGYGLFAAVSFDEGKSWPVRKLITPGGPERTVPGVDKREFTLSDTMSEPSGYLSACQTRDDLIQLISSKNHHVFNLAWLKTLPPAPGK
jgi:formylglycine-generating enzyme required for sulfatase activity